MKATEQYCTFLWYCLLCCTRWFQVLNLWMKSSSVTIQRKATEQYCRVTLFFLQTEIWFCLFPSWNERTTEPCLLIFYSRVVQEQDRDRATLIPPTETCYTQDEDQRQYNVEPPHPNPVHKRRGRKKKKQGAPPPPPDLGNKRNKFYHEAFSCSYSAIDCAVVSSFSFALGSVWSTRFSCWVFFVSLRLYILYRIKNSNKTERDGLFIFYSVAKLVLL